MTIKEKYNALPIEVREITSQVLLLDQIRDLLIERARAIKHHKSHLREIDAHIENCKRDLITNTTVEPRGRYEAR
jgi:hypothetical protein